MGATGRETISHEGPSSLPIFGDEPRSPAPTDPERGEDVFDVPLGAIVTDEARTRWVFVGWRNNTAGRNAWFVEEQKGRVRGEVWTYNASHAETLERKFPDIARFRVGKI